jgi:hypothetical protein
MGEIRYYRWAAALPVVLPLLAYPVGWHTPARGGVIEWVAVLIVLSGIAGGPPYVPFICGLLWCLRSRPVAAYRCASLIAPLLFAPVFVLYLLVLAYFRPSPEPFLDNVIFYLRYVFGVGFAYVVLVHALRLGLSCAGCLSDREAAV